MVNLNELILNDGVANYYYSIFLSIQIRFKVMHMVNKNEAIKVVHSIYVRTYYNNYFTCMGYGAGKN